MLKSRILQVIFLLNRGAANRAPYPRPKNHINEEKRVPVKNHIFSFALSVPATPPTITTVSRYTWGFKSVIANAARMVPLNVFRVFVCYINFNVTLT